MHHQTESSYDWSVGLTAHRKNIEIHVVNSRNEVVLEGWFPMEAGLALVCGRPTSLIAIDGETLPDDLVSDLACLGHPVVVVPPTTDFFDKPTRRRAKDIHDLGRTLLDVMH